MLARGLCVARSGLGLSSSRALYSSFVQGEPPILLSKDKTNPSIAIITLNKPDKLNSLSVAVGETFKAVVEEIKADKGVRAVVVTGNGRAFSAGGDLQFLLDRTRSSSEQNVEEMVRFYKRFLSIRSLPVPTLAAINGAAVGAGMCLALACDLRPAIATNAKLSVNFVRLGLHPGLASTYFLPRLIGPHAAAQLLLTGETIDAQTAQRLGLVSEVKPAEEVLEYTLSVANKIASASPVAVQSLLQTLRKRLDADLEFSLLDEAEGQAISYASPDILEGLKAISEKRDPKF